MSEISLPQAELSAARRAFTMHERVWQRNRYVYPVVSRRSKGVSIGINLNPDKVCNFDCIYCSVDRTVPIAAGVTRDIDLGVLQAELAAMIASVESGDLYQHDPFDRIPVSLRRVNDLAFSGDGEPTTCPQFDEAAHLAAETLAHAGASLSDTKLVLITNATMFHKPQVQATLAFLDEHRGEIWAKLDAGTEAYYQRVDRTGVGFNRVLENLAWSCRVRATVIQSLFMRIHGEGPGADEIQAYTQRLAEVAAAGREAGHGIKLVQIYTVARRTTEAYATPLNTAELETIAQQVRSALPGTPVEVYP